MAQIALLLGHSANQRLLSSELAAEHEVWEGVGSDAEDAPDLVITDPLGFHSHGEALRELHRSQVPRILPSLLVATSQNNPSAGRNQRPDEYIDDVLNVPTTRPELRARINNLLRVRALTQEQARQELAYRRDLQATHRGQIALNACNEVLIRASSVAQVPTDLC